MGYQIIDGKKVAKEIQEQIKKEVEHLKQLGQKVPHIAAVLVGNDGASETYVNNKIKACNSVGFQSTLVRLPEYVTENKLLEEVEKLNQNEDIDGFIVQLPLPRHINEQKVIEAIVPSKDIDGFHPINVGRMVLNLPCYVSATPYGIVQLLEYYKIETSGKHCVVIGRSHIVGSPMSILMAKNTPIGNATVTLCHSKTKDLKQYTLQADIIICAIGSPHFLTADMVKEGVVVIDVGITRIESKDSPTGYKLLGDVKFDEVAPKCSYITPVPGGVGPMTIASLLKNGLLAAKKEIYR
ncbi:MAG: bifunctional 5,10-methylene-tetrahydrofolate dehydrogenase/5,10-methylene-tetrahydrofolate cyclohydrolase [Bacteroidia bacterium]|nr:bifunctional 5,10-methylene-tetrahydrofolate dehydrogenase/5,10-methylene-tetrahydrofolate cyclohydrolase [Bacteroidia bacterium]